MPASNPTFVFVRRTAFGLLLALAGACDCSGSDGPADPVDTAPDADVGTGDVSEDTSTDTGEDTSGDTESDAESDATPDADPDGTPDAEEDADVPEERAVRSVITNTAGGGVVSSPNTRAVIGLGAPQPAGNAEGENTSVTTGPGAARP